MYIAGDQLRDDTQTVDTKLDLLGVFIHHLQFNHIFRNAFYRF